MQLECLGVGEAFDPELGNASYLLHSDTNLLVDCGYAVPRFFFSRGYPSDYVDAIYLTHFHADHTFGLPALIIRWLEEGRQKPLKVLGQVGTQEKCRALLQSAYSNLFEKISYPIEYIETLAPIGLGKLRLSFALSSHTVPNYAVKIASNKRVIGVSGDGALTEETRELFKDCTALVHEAYMFEVEKYGHESARVVASFCQSIKKLTHLYFVHIQREERQRRRDDFLKLGKGFQVALPEAGDKI